MKCTRSFICFAVLIFVGCVPERPVRPSIIFICADDQAHWTLGASGNRQSFTPNMDRLAAEGAYFRNAFATTPVCSPARVSMMTSQYASEFGIADFIPHPGHKLYSPRDTIGLDPASVTYSEVLKKGGYVNGLVGKWHLGDWTMAEDKKFHPRNHGFDYFMGLTGGGTSPKDPTLEKDCVVKKFEGFTEDILTDHAIEFITANHHSPFLLCLNFRAPHTAWLPVRDEDLVPYEDLDVILPDPDYPDLDVDRVKKEMKEYLASTSSVDRNLGRICRLLDELDIAKNTVIIFTSDHGYNMGHNGIKHKGNGNFVTMSDHPATENIAENSRPNMYDNSLRVPALVRWPGVVEPGTIINETISALDWYPTIIEMSGLEIPENKIVRGRSVLSLLKGQAVDNWNNDLYAEYSMINYSRAYMRCYRTPEWKLVKDFLDPARDELYHLKVDPEENDNLIREKSDTVRIVVDMLTAKIYENMTIVNDTLLKSHAARP